MCTKPNFSIFPTTDLRSNKVYETCYCYKVFTNFIHIIILYLLVLGVGPDFRVQHCLQDEALGAEDDSMSVELLAVLRDQHHITQARVVDVRSQVKQRFCIIGERNFKMRSSKFTSYLIHYWTINFALN